MVRSAASSELDEKSSIIERRTALLAIPRSRSFEVPKDNRTTNELRHEGGFYADFVPGHPESTYHQHNNPAYWQQRHSMSHLVHFTLKPKMQQRQSLGRSVSSFSLYKHFRGERFDASRTTQDTPLDEKSEKLDKDACAEKIAASTDYDLNKPTASVGKAMFTFLKAFIGSGVLFLPKAFESGGLVLSTVLMILIALVCHFAIIRLVRTQLLIGGSYGNMGGLLYGQVVRFMVLFFLCISQIGFVCSYFVFASGNLVNVVDVLSACRAGLAQKYYIWIPLVVVIPFSLVRHIARLSLAAVVADFFILVGLVSVLYFTAAELHTRGIGPNVRPVNAASFGMTMATATFSYEGIGLVIPIMESMEKPERFPFVVTLGMVVVCVIYVLIGSLSYLAYGDHIQAAVLYNFPPENKLTIAVQLIYTAAIILTIPLLLFPALRILESGIFRHFEAKEDEHHFRWAKAMFSIVVCCMCATVAFLIGGDNLDKFVSLVGSVACVPLCFIFPGLFHYKVATTRTGRFLDLSLAAWGFCIMVFTLYETIGSFVRPVSGIFPLTPYCPV